MTYRGFSLVETLVAGVIAGVIAMGNIYSLKFAMQAGTVSRAILTESDFRTTVNKALGEDCTDNLGLSDASKRLNSADVSVPVDNLKFKNEIVITAGETFKTDIEVVKMEVKTEGNLDTRPSDFIIYYKKNNLGHLNTVSKQPCENTNLDGCYTKKCRLNYFLAENAFDKCEILNCHGIDMPRVALSGYPCKWGELYNPDHEKNGKPKCDNREGTGGGSGTCAKPTGSKFIGNEGTSRTVVDGKCVCKKSTRIKTVDGLCMTRRKIYGSAECWPRPGDRPYDFDNSSNKTAWDTAMYNFCSKEYQGTEPCIWREVYDDKPEDKSVLDRPGKIQYFKRVYNRETGEVDCHVAERKYTVRPGGCNDSVVNARHCERFVQLGKTRLFKQRQIPESWFMPQTQ